MVLIEKHFWNWFCIDEKHVQRPTIIDQKGQVAVLRLVEINRAVFKSILQSLKCGVSRTDVSKILKLAKFHPYNINLVVLK